MVNALAAAAARDPQTGRPYSEALALGASGGIAFGNFVFAYTGHLPHVALLTRNTFGPFERTLDNLAIKREVRETTNAERAERNLRMELDAGNFVIVWADKYTLSYTGLGGDQVWAMMPILVIEQEGSDFLVVDGTESAFTVSAEELSRARARVKKDRFQMIVPEAPDPAKIPEGLKHGIKTCCALFLDKPPAGSPNNFGITGLRHWAKMLVDRGNAKGWTRTFPPGPELVQALAGSHGQPGAWDWIERFGTASGADRETYADFLEEAAVWTGLPELRNSVGAWRESADLWRALAEASMPDEVAEFRGLKALKTRYAEIWFTRALESLEERAAIRREMAELTASAASSAVLGEVSQTIFGRMSEIAFQIAAIEEEAVLALRGVVK
jgi:hypothetical protein